MSLKKYKSKGEAVEVTVNRKKENLRVFSGFRPRIRPLYSKILIHCWAQSSPGVKIKLMTSE